MPKLTGWRRVAAAMWPPPNDPQIYGELELDATPVLNFIQEARDDGYHVTPTTVVGKAMAHALRKVPELNTRIVGLRAIPRKSIDIFFITAVGAGQDLSGVKVRHVDGRSAADVAQELAARSSKVRAGDDPEFAMTKTLMERLPRPALAGALKLTTLLTERLQLDIPSLALHASPFGSAMVSSVGMLGLPHGFSPLSWMYDVPLMVLVGAIDERPWVVDHQVVVRPVLPIMATIDHRYVDGAHISRLLGAFRSYLDDPSRHEHLPKPRSQASTA
jgi:pyruvate/2-oxoglutarate dehydrogenase complex dihydrolipoamide acyltransferase (E2) component